MKEDTHKRSHIVGYHLHEMCAQQANLQIQKTDWCLSTAQEEEKWEGTVGSDSQQVQVSFGSDENVVKLDYTEEFRNCT